MFYTQNFEKDYGHLIGTITQSAHLHFDPIIYTDLFGNLVGCNEALLELLNVGGIEDISALELWFDPQGVNLSYLLSKSGDYRGKIRSGDIEYDVAVKSEVLLLDNQPIIGVVFRDTSIIERARAAERYFEHFKNKFLTNISHEFRTPMNAIIGFTDLLKGSPLSSWQQEYVQMTSRSAQSMMRNIENLLELMQVESGSIHTTLALFNPLEVYENFSMQFCDLALSKEIGLMFLIDPHLPKTMIGDQDKILAIMRNLIQNGIKFTEEGGSVLVEILIVKEEGNFVEVEYAVSDTGIGIESERIKTLLRPFASAWDNQRKGKDGLGIGLSLSHKYVDMMDSHLMLASESGKGSRFSFRITHQINEIGSFDFVEGTRAAIYTQDQHLTPQGALLHKYLELFNVQVKGVHDLVNTTLHESDVLFLDIPHIAKAQIDALKSTYSNLQIVPIMKLDYGEKANAVMDSVASIVTLPILPSSLHKTMAVIWNMMPKEYISRSPEAQSIPRADNIKILVAEDNLINLKLLETILHQEHFRVVAVENGQKAVDAYLKEHFDLVLMDIDMPVMDGLTANRLIKEIDKRDGRGFVPVIALTAHALIGDRERIVAAGLDAHLAKPIDKHFLIQTMDRYLKIAQQKRQNNTV
ncbi:histidine kinase [Sulfuricurvum kujiense DSM 16994]|uniref:histidine kinase n=1 Tax=Sulfuricurvum kujiense (strain ATCC BAA-921 / DSM 16994 / JCM 11577 / YK-1) TaxID=709032 RepID=E4U0R4_SULKY|nr:response regulator [Sulfuricurvum kujiense]ADR33290.1 histidine kinase [Sulfuricurvum kujiense DSM 16994]